MTLFFKNRNAFPEDMQTDSELRKIVISWDKFVALADLLEYTLSDIAEALPKFVTLLFHLLYYYFILNDCSFLQTEICLFHRS